MRKITKDFTQVPALLLACSQEKHQKLLGQAERHVFDAQCYNQGSIADLRRIYHDKCAYCETRFPEDKSGKLIAATVEHYRPKRNGYYWLGYEWSNLMLVCEGCNNAKGDKFEIKGVKIKKPLLNTEGVLDLSKCRLDCVELQKEKPLFINPEIDEPSALFYFTKSGELKATDDNDRANYTIKELQLNRNNLWILRRKKFIDEIERDIESQVLKYLELYGQQGYDERAIALAFFSIFKKIVRMQDEKAEFTLLGKSIFENFNTFLIEPMGQNIGLVAQKIVAYAFGLFLKQVS